MRCPECNGTGETNYYVEVHRDENSVSMAKRKDICRTCNGSGEVKQTNADRIRAMSDEKLAVWLKVNLDCAFCPVGISCTEGKSCYKLLLEWLRQPAEE